MEYGEEIEATHLTVEEFHQTIQDMSESDRSKLRQIATMYANVYKIDGEVLLQEAFCRVLENKRPCPTNLYPVRFLAGVMKSISWDQLKERIQRENIEAPVDPDQATPIVTNDLLISIEDDETGADLRQRVLALFEDDTEAQLIVEGMMEGIKGEELREIVELDKTAFDSKRRLVRRRINQSENLK